MLSDEWFCLKVDLDNIDEEEFPKVVDLEFMDCILEEGEMLYIPPKWWHYVRSLTTSFSVSFWWSWPKPHAVGCPQADPSTYLPFHFFGALGLHLLLGKVKSNRSMGMHSTRSLTGFIVIFVFVCVVYYWWLLINWSFELIILIQMGFVLFCKWLFSNSICFMFVCTVEFSGPPTYYQLSRKIFFWFFETSLYMCIYIYIIWLCSCPDSFEFPIDQPF